MAGAAVAPVVDLGGYEAKPRDIHVAGVAERAVMAQTGHKSLPMVRMYIRGGSIFRENAAEVGL